MDVIMPKMGESVSEGTIIKWHKKKGDAVKRDEIIFEISTDKVDTEIPSPIEGVLSEIKVNEGDTVEVGTVVAVIEGNGETKSEAKSETKQAAQVEKKEELKVERKTEHVPAPSVEKEKKGPVESAAGKTTARQSTSNGNIIEIAMPKMGESVMEGTIIKWHKKVGDKVNKDETIFEISTDKVDTEVPSPAEGIVNEILVAEQETVEVGTIVAKLSSGSAQVKAKEEKGSLPEVTKAETVKAAEPKNVPVESLKEKVVVKAVSDETAKTGGSRFLSPLVLNIARKENVSFNEIDTIKGTGLDGRVTKKDILDYIENRKTKPVESKATSSPATAKEEKVPVPSFDYSSPKIAYLESEVEKIPMDNIRQKIMQHMVNSRDTSVHVSALIEVDMSKIYNFIQKNKDEYQKNLGLKLTYMSFIADACVRGLKEFSLINSAIEGSTIIRKKFINLGIAVAIEPTGLIVPNIKNAGDKNIIGLAKSISDIAYRARNKKLTPDDITNGTFTITNYGVFGTIFGTPIINQPEVAILGVGTVVKRPVVVEVDGADSIAIKPIMALTLSHDHRLVDGMLGGKFLKFMKDTLESFNETSL